MAVLFNWKVLNEPSMYSSYRTRGAGFFEFSQSSSLEWLDLLWTDDDLSNHFIQLSNRLCCVLQVEQSERKEPKRWAIIRRVVLWFQLCLVGRKQRPFQHQISRRHARYVIRPHFLFFLLYLTIGVVTTFDFVYTRCDELRLSSLYRPIGSHVSFQIVLLFCLRSRYNLTYCKNSKYV